MMNCEWVTADNGALVMQWTEQKGEETAKPLEVESAAVAVLEIAYLSGTSVDARRELPVLAGAR
jgi:hypothetical protein